MYTMLLCVQLFPDSLLFHLKKWIPAMKERSVEFARDAGPHIQRLKTKTIHLYHESKKFMEPHIRNAQEVIQPFVQVYLFLHLCSMTMVSMIIHISLLIWQEVRKVADPYVDQVSLVMNLHIDKARILLQPYTKKVHRHYKKVKKTVSSYHHQA